MLVHFPIQIDLSIDRMFYFTQQQKFPFQNQKFRNTESIEFEYILFTFFQYMVPNTYKIFIQTHREMQAGIYACYFSDAETEYITIYHGDDISKY